MILAHVFVSEKEPDSKTKIRGNKKRKTKKKGRNERKQKEASVRENEKLMTLI